MSIELTGHRPFICSLLVYFTSGIKTGISWGRAGIETSDMISGVNRPFIMLKLFQVYLFWPSYVVNYFENDMKYFLVLFYIFVALCLESSNINLKCLY